MKCELALKHCGIPSVCNIPVKDSMIYLRIVIKDEKARCNLNFDVIIDKTQKKLNQWLQQDLLIRERTLLTKPEGISRLTYAALSLDVNKKIVNDRQNAL